jgi:hypothetical protein
MKTFGWLFHEEEGVLEWRLRERRECIRECRRNQTKSDWLLEYWQPYMKTSILEDNVVPESLLETNPS